MTALRENDVGRFKEYSSRNRAFSLRDKFNPPNGRFFPLKEKIADNFTSARDLARERHVPPIKLVFLVGGPSSLRYKMMSPRAKFTSPKDMVRNKHVFSMERVSEMCEVYHSS